MSAGDGSVQVDQAANGDAHERRGRQVVLSAYNNRRMTLKMRRKHR